ncbi:MAG: hypothetical protein ACI8QG_002742, partial [Flavobacteriales bacterium]
QSIQADNNDQANLSHFHLKTFHTEQDLSG